MLATAAEKAESEFEMNRKPPALLPGKSYRLMDALVDDSRNNHDGDENTSQVENVTDVKSPRNSRTNPSRYDQKKADDLLEEEIAIRHQIRSMPGAQGKGGICYVISSTVVNMVSAILVFAVYLISLESLLSIGLGVGLTICKFGLSKYR
jgi:hypothetical protein